MSTHPPFFLVGSARSGTTMLRLMLNAHPDIAVPPESRFISELWTGAETVDVDKFMKRLEGHPLFALWDLPIEAVRGELPGSPTVPFRSAVEAPYKAWMHLHGKTRWGDKTPRYIESIPLLTALWPDARIVHIVRDGRDVALSYADVPFGPKTVARAADLWARRVRAGTEHGRSLGSDRYLEVRYEDLVADIEGGLRALSSFLHVPFDPVMLDTTARARGVIKSRAASYNPKVTAAPGTSGRNWRQQMPPGRVEVFEAVAGDVLAKLGYERRFPTPGWRARAAAILGRIGVPVGRLRSSRSS